MWSCLRAAAADNKTRGSPRSHFRKDLNRGVESDLQRSGGHSRLWLSEGERGKMGRGGARNALRGMSIRGVGGLGMDI
jgi:hypothetical protein